MNYIDISWPITTKMTAYKNRGDNLFFEETKTWSGDQARETSICMGLHTGTHVDAPSHMISSGKPTGLESVIVGECQVLDLTDVQSAITVDDLLKHELKADNILLKTSNSSLSDTAPFNYNFVYLDHSGAAYLIERGIKAVGIDYLGIERDQPNHETHIALLHNGVRLIEGLRLAQAQAGVYNLFCFPLAIVGYDAAPARVVLLPKDH